MSSAASGVDTIKIQEGKVKVNNIKKIKFLIL